MCLPAISFSHDIQGKSCLRIEGMILPHRVLLRARIPLIGCVFILHSFTNDLNPQTINIFRVKDFVFAILHRTVFSPYSDLDILKKSFTAFTLIINELSCGVKEVKDKNMVLPVMCARMRVRVKKIPNADAPKKSKIHNKVFFSVSHLPTSDLVFSTSEGGETTSYLKYSANLLQLQKAKKNFYWTEQSFR